MEIYIGLIQEAIPVRLGTTGTIILSLLTMLSASINLWQFYKSKNVERLNSALHTTETEMNVYKSRAERQSKELAEANQTIGELNAKTDLSAVLTMLSETITLSRESIELSRKADRENSQFNAAMARTFEKHGESDKEVFNQIRDSLLSQLKATEELSKAVQEHRDEAREAFRALLKGKDER